MNIILLEPADLFEPGRARLTGRRLEHIRGVLHAAVGDSLRIGVINGSRGLGRILEIGKDSVVIDCAFDAEPSQPPALDLIAAVPRPQTLKKLLLEATTLGVRRFFFIRARRTERSYLDSKLFRDEEYRSHLRLGLEQCGDTREPELSLHPRFRPFIEDELEGLLKPGSLRVLADPEGRTPLHALRPGAAPIVLSIGPEGGWVPYEREQFIAHGFIPVALGPRILRVETATIAAMAILEALRAFPAAAS